MSTTTVTDLAAGIAALAVPDEVEVATFTAHLDQLIGWVDDAVLGHPRADELLGGNSPRVARDNHRNHATYLAETFRAGTLEDVPGTAVWAYRAYLGQGVHPDYWRVHLPAWSAAMDHLGIADDLPNVRAIYTWFEDHHEDFLELSGLDPAMPDLSDPLAEDFAEHLLALDLVGSIDAVERAADAGHGITDILTTLIDPALVQVGSRWEEGRFTPAQEHRATAIATRIIGGLLADLDLGEGGAGSILVTAAESEFHDVGALVLAVCFESTGWDVTFLGANVPDQDVVAMARELQPDVVAVSVMIPNHLASVRSLTDSVRRETSARVLIGGGLFRQIPSLARAVDGDLVTADPIEAIKWATSR